jgi:O-antigen/teichoic acid export membrane protein
MNKTIKNRVMGNKTDHTRDNFIWNVIGSVLYAAATILLVRFTKGAAGTGTGADFNIAFKTGQILLTIGYFEIRPFQVTDVTGEYTFCDYFSFRILTCALMLLAGFLFPLVKGEQGERFALFFLLCLYKLMDGAADVMEGEFQKNGRMDLAGKSVAFRTVFSVAVYGVAVMVTRQVVLSTCLMVAAAAAGVLLFDVPLIREFADLRVSFDKDRMGKLVRSTGLLFIGSILCLYIFNASNYAVDGYFQGTDPVSEDIRYIYACLFMPTSVINLASGFLFKPILTTMAEDFASKRYEKFAGVLGKLLLGVGGITVACLIGGAWLGLPALSLVYGYDLAGYLTELEILILGGGFNAAGIILYYAMTVMRKQRDILISYCMVAVATLAVSTWAVARWGLMGAALSYCGLMALQTLIFGGMTWFHYSGEKRRNR